MAQISKSIGEVPYNSKTLANVVKRSQGLESKFEQTYQSEEFRALLRQKRNFIVPMTILFLTYFFALPILTGYTKILNQPFFGSITWAWVLAFSQFIMTWTFCMLYSKKASEFDLVSESIKKSLDDQEVDQ